VTMGQPGGGPTVRRILVGLQLRRLRIERGLPQWFRAYVDLERPGAPMLWAVIDEAALCRPVGGPKVMRAQLEVTLQILPFSAGAHPAMVGTFTILRFPDAELPDAVCLEHLTNAPYLDKRDDVDQYFHVMETVCVRAASPDRTARILSRILQEENNA
jgi:hypothetical protein